MLGRTWSRCAEGKIYLWILIQCENFTKIPALFEKMVDPSFIVGCKPEDGIIRKVAVFRQPTARNISLRTYVYVSLREFHEQIVQKCVPLDTSYPCELHRFCVATPHCFKLTCLTYKVNEQIFGLPIFTQCKRLHCPNVRSA